MTPFEELKMEAQAIKEFLEEPIPKTLSLIEEKGSMTVIYHARTGEMLADAKSYLRSAMSREVIEFIEKTLSEAKLSAKIQNAFIDSVCNEEAHLVDLVERLNKTCKLQAEWMRSLMSNTREEMKLAGYQV